MLRPLLLWRMVLSLTIFNWRKRTFRFSERTKWCLSSVLSVSVVQTLKNKIRFEINFKGRSDWAIEGSAYFVLNKKKNEIKNKRKKNKKQKRKGSRKQKKKKRGGGGGIPQQGFEPMRTFSNLRISSTKVTPLDYKASRHSNFTCRMLNINICLKRISCTKFLDYEQPLFFLYIPPKVERKNKDERKLGWGGARFIRLLASPKLRSLLSASWFFRSFLYGLSEK